MGAGDGWETWLRDSLVGNTQETEASPPPGGLRYCLQSPKVKMQKGNTGYTLLLAHIP